MLALDSKSVTNMEFKLTPNWSTGKNFSITAEYSGECIGELVCQYVDESIEIIGCQVFQRGLGVHTRLCKVLADLMKDKVKRIVCKVEIMNLSALSNLGACGFSPVKRCGNELMLQLVLK